MIFSKKQKVKVFIEAVNPKIEVSNYMHFSNYRITKIEKAQTLKAKQLNIQTELLLLKAINFKNNNINNNLDEIIINENDKPSFKLSNIKFNITHSNQYLAVAISNNNIGIDIEKIDLKHLKVARKLFDEINYLKYKDNIDEIIKVWTIKEAYIKLFGSTILRSLKDITITKNEIIGPLGLAYYKTIKINNYYLTIASLNKLKTTVYRDNDINI